MTPLSRQRCHSKSEKSFRGKLSRFLVSVLLLLYISVYLYFWFRRKPQEDRSEEFQKSQPNIAHKKLCFDYERFATSPDDFKAWFDYLFDLFPFPTPITSAIMGVLVFCGGLFISLTICFGTEYLQTPAIYVGCFGIAWVLGVLRRASRTVHEVYEDLRPCFLVEDEEYRRITSGWFSKMASHWGNFLVSFSFFFLAVIAVIIRMFLPDVMQSLTIRSLGPLFFPDYWFSSENLEVKAAIVIYYGFLIALPLGTSARLMALNLLFLLDLQRLPVIPAARIIRARLQKLTNLYVFVSGSWFVGVALFASMFFRNVDVLAALFLGFLSLLGILVFLIPQLILTRYLARSYRLACDWSLQTLNDILGIELKERPRGDSKLKIRPVNPGDLANIVDSTSRPEMLIYDVGDLLVLIVGQMLVVASAFVQPLVEQFMTRTSP